MGYEDHIEGTGRNRYFYRIGRMDAAGNRSELGLSTLPVAVPDVVPPQAPVVIRAAGKDRQAVLRWRRNSELGMKRYELYRTTNPAHVKDIRQMGEPVRIDANVEGVPLRVSVLEGRAYVTEVTFNRCATVSNISPIEEQGQPVTTNNWFAGFERLTVLMSVDEGKMNIVYTDMNGSTQSQVIRGIQGQLKWIIPNGSEPVREITGVYRQTDVDLTNNVYLGISSGAIRLQGEDVETSRDQQLSITYSDQEGVDYTVTSLHHEMEMIDESLEEGHYYYRLVAIREGAIGEDVSGNERMFELSSYPTKAIKVRVLNLSPPTPPVWKKAQWVKIDSQGQVHDWEDTGSDLAPAILLEWQHGSVSQPVYSVQRKTEQSWIWQTVGSELEGDEQYIDVQAEVDLSTQYRIRTVSDIETATLTETRIVSAIEPKD